MTHIHLLAPLIQEAGVIAVFFVISFLLYWRTRPCYFYFVRHGETILNAQHIRQGDKGGLTEKGKKQAQLAGEYLSQFPIRHLYSSPFERTVETATLVNESLRASIAYTPLLGERRNPSEIIGKRADDPEVKRIVSQIDLSFHDDNTRFSDEENFTDLKMRARRCMRYLQKHRHSHTGVVTHSIFLILLVAYMVREEDLHASDYVKMEFFHPADNGGITVCIYHPLRRLLYKKPAWEVITYSASLPSAFYLPPTSGTQNTAVLK